MARIEGVSEKSGNLLYRAFAWSVRRRLGRDMGPLRGYARSTPVMLAVAGMELGMERAHRVDPRLRNLAELRVAALVGCRFCLDIGSALIRKLGVPESQLRDLNDYETSAAFSALEKAVLRYTDAMTATPVDIDEENFEFLRRHFDESQIVELTAAIAHENLRARMNHALGYGAEGFTEGACALPATQPLRHSANVH